MTDLLFTPETSRAVAQRDLARAFAVAGLDTPALDARILLCAALAIDHVALVRDSDLPLGAAAAPLALLGTRRLAHEPVARILGRREFWGLSFAIGPAVLDPRPDTEILVEAVLEALAGRRGDRLRLLDLGTGSGAILCSLLHELPGAFGIGLDLSFGACLNARLNRDALGLAERCAIVQGSWSDALAGPFDVVVSNPPYIPAADIGTLAAEVRCFDPPAALDGGADGLDPYRAIVPCLSGLLGPGGIAALEGGATQGRTIAAMLRHAGLAGVIVRSDLAGHERVALGRAAA